MENRLQSGPRSVPLIKVSAWPFHHSHGLRARGQEFAAGAPGGLSDPFRIEHERRTFALATNAIREEEKARVARELHDELAQSLTALKMDALWVRDHAACAPETVAARLSEMVAMIDRTVAATRRIAADLRPMVLDDLGLVPAIEWLVGSFTQRSGVACQLSVDEGLELALQEPYATAVFRIVQESLANVAKHAAASQVRVVLNQIPEGVMLRVQDDGCGFLTTMSRKSESMGLMGLRERAQLLGGHACVKSGLGQGTCVEVYIPLPESAEGGSQ